MTTNTSDLQFRPAEKSERRAITSVFLQRLILRNKERIRVLGLAPEAPDCARIGQNWVRPIATQAWQRLSVDSTTDCDRTSRSLV